MRNRDRIEDGVLEECNTRGFDNPVLVGFGGVTVPFAIRESLNHLLLVSPLFISSLSFASECEDKTETKEDYRKREELFIWGFKTLDLRAPRKSFSTDEINYLFVFVFLDGFEY